MEFSMRKSSFNKSSQGSSSFKNRSRNSASYDSNTSNHSDDEDNNNRNYNEGEVIVKIESPVEEDDVRNKKTMNDDNVAGSTSSLWRGSSEEFSFPSWPTGENRLEEEDDDDQRRRGGNPLSSKLLEMEIEMDEAREQNEQGDGSTVMARRQGGLPPLPRGPIDTSYWSRNQGEIQSPDHSTTSSFHQSKITTTTTPNNNNINGQSRVSFHESLTSQLARRPSSMYSNVQDDDTSSCTSSMSGDDQDNHNNNVYDNNHSAEILNRCPSNNNNNNMANNNSAVAANSFRRMSLSKTKSRLIDPPPTSTPIDQRSGAIPKSGQLNMRSGLLGKSSMLDDDEDDPFLEDDFPDEFKGGANRNISALMVLEWVSLISIMGALICSLVIPILREKTVWNMKLWKWEVLILVLICGRLVSNWGIRIIVFLIERNFLLRKRVLYFVYGLKKAVQNVIWLGLVLLTWFFLFDKKVLMESRSEPLRVVTKLIIIGEVGAILWLLKTLLVKVLASNFNVKAFFDRIQDSLFNQFVIETLSAPPMFELRQAQEEEERTMAEVQSLQNAGVNVPPDLHATVFGRTKSGKPRNNNNNNNNNNNTFSYKSPGIGQSTKFSETDSKKNVAPDNEGITIHHLHKLNQKNVSAWNMKRLMKIIRNGSLNTLDEQIVDGTIRDDESSIHIRSEIEAKAAATKIFRNVAKPRSRYIYVDDIMRFMREDEALKTMNLFEGAIENERINKKSLKNWVVSAFRERRALALTLNDTKTAVNKLHKMANVFVTIVIIIIGIIYLDIVTSQSLLFLSSQVVVVAFVFGNTCKNVFESIIFLFVIHPYDVGDRCEIDATQMVVDEINILTTVFLRYDNQRIVYPNYVLLTKPIHNYYRSPDMGDGIELCFHVATPAEKIAVIRQRITSYIENKKEHWYPSPMIVLKDTDGLQMLRIAIWLQHRMNHQDMGERWVRRALLIEECIRIFRDMDIEYRVYPLNVNVTAVPPLNYAYVPTEGGKDVVHP